MIEASFATQYGIRLRTAEDMTWAEFCCLLGGLGPETPLGRIVAIRSEKDPARLRGFTAGEKKIRSAWRHKGYEKNGDNKDWEKEIAALQDVLKRAFSPPEAGGTLKQFFPI